MERDKPRPGWNVLLAALAVSTLGPALGCSAAHPPATQPDARPRPDRRSNASPAQRLDGGGSAVPPRARPGGDTGFERGIVREESLTGAPEEAAHDRSARAATADDPESPEADASPDEGEGDAHAAPGELRHVLQRGQTLYSVSRMYGVTLDALRRANGIHDARKVAAGTPLVIPLPRPRRAASQTPREETPKGRTTDTESAPAVRKAGRTAFLWPIEGTITGPFGQRGRHEHHEGIDIDGSDGDRIKAAASGTVVLAGSNGDYGRTVIIDHGNGLRTLYGHASRLFVKEGDEVRAGDLIAAVGHSGNARGSHLHFEVRRDGRPVNPLAYLLPPDVLTAGAVTLPPHTTRPASRRH